MSINLKFFRAMKTLDCILPVLALIHFGTSPNGAANPAVTSVTPPAGAADVSCSTSRTAHYAWSKLPERHRSTLTRAGLQPSAKDRLRLGIGFTNSETHLTIHGRAGDAVSLERTGTLGTASWQPVATFNLWEDTTAWRLNPDQESAGFFRLRSADITPLVAEDFSLIDTEGKRRHLLYHAADTNLDAIVLVFTGVGISPENPQLKALASAESDASQPSYQQLSRKLRVKTWLVASSSGGGRAGLTTQAKATGLGDPSMPVLHDPEMIVARLYGVTSTLCAVCIDREDGMIFYKGAIGSGSGLEHLISALVQHSEAGVVRNPWIEPTGGALLPPPPPVPDYVTDIAPILRAKCITCHRPGTAAPWSMTNHTIVRAYAQLMQQDILSGHMPPWGADPEIGNFSNDRSLNSRELAQLVGWLKAGAPRGTGPDPLGESAPEPPPRWPEDLGEPDIVLHWPEQKIKAFGVEPYRYADMTLPTDKPVWIRGAMLRPSNYAVTHHLVASRQRPPGGGIPEIAGYAPGWELQRFPEGTGRRMAAHGIISLEMHYTPNGTPQVDTPELALWLSPTPPARELVMDAVESVTFRVAPNDPDSTHTAEATFDRSFTIYDFTPHMHLRGARMRYEAFYPGGKSETLLSVPHYDFHWQNTYTLAEPKRMPAGTRIRITAGFDNSALNPHNPDPNRVVWWGQQSKQEMMIGFFNLTWN